MPGWIWFFIIVVGIPVLFGFLSDMHKRRMKLRERELEMRARIDQEAAEISTARMERLEQRVRVLERIITDKGLGLAEEIERLRDKPLN